MYWIHTMFIRVVAKNGFYLMGVHSSIPISGCVSPNIHPSPLEIVSLVTILISRLLLYPESIQTDVYQMWVTASTIPVSCCAPTTNKHPFPISWKSPPVMIFDWSLIFAFKMRSANTYVCVDFIHSTPITQWMLDLYCYKEKYTSIYNQRNT